MSLKIKVYFDYICPFCNIAKYPFLEAIKNKDVEVEYLPYEVVPCGECQLDPINDEDMANMWKYEVFPLIEKLNIDMKLPNISPHPYTNITFEGYHFAKKYNKGNEYNELVFKAFFVKEQNIGDIDVLSDIAKEIGLDKEKFKKCLNQRIYKIKQEECIYEAYKNTKIEMVPTFIIGDTIVAGVKTKEQYEEIINNELKKLGY